MLTGFITSQHDRGDCLCMGINILPNLTGELTSPSPLPSSRGADSRESGQRDYSSLPSFPLPPCCLPTPPLHSHLTRWSTINRNPVLSSTIAALSFLPKPRSQTPPLQNLLWRGFSFQPTSRPNSVDTDSNTTEGELVADQRAYRRRPTPLETQDKTTEMAAHSPLPTVYA